MLSSLKYLSLDENPITSLPESMNNLAKLHTLEVSGCRNLTILPELPHDLKQLVGRDCPSLKRIANLPNLDMSPDLDINSYYISLDPVLWYCGKLVDAKSWWDTLRSSFMALDSDLSDPFDLVPKGGIEVQRNYFSKPKGGLEVQRNYFESFTRRSYVQVESFTRRSYVQGTYECGILSIFVHGSKIPDRFNYRSMGNTVFSIIVPSHLNLKIVGLNACILYGRQSDRIARCRNYDSLELRNETKGIEWRCLLFHEVEWKVMNEDMLWLSHWIMGNNELECGEEVCFKIKEQSGVLTKDIGVQFVYKQQNKDKEDVLSSSEDTTTQRERSPWEWSQSFLETTRPRVPEGVETGVQCIHNCDKKVISTVICAAEYFFCNSEMIDLDLDREIIAKGHRFSDF